jgi:hypothetical protein
MIRLMSFFLPPVTNKVPKQEVSVEMLHRTITSSAPLREATERVRQQLATGNANYYRAEKQHMLPYVIPSGVFRYGAAKDLVYLNGLQVVDIDGLSSPKEATDLRDRLFADEELQALLAFVSPSGRGVKLFVPYEPVLTAKLEDTFRLALERTWGYIEWKYNVAVDHAGADIARGCLICHDPNARIRQTL